MNVYLKDRYQEKGWCLVRDTEKAVGRKMPTLYMCSGNQVSNQRDFGMEAYRRYCMVSSVDAAIRGS